MQKRIQTVINKIVNGKTFANDDELYLYLVIIGAAIFALVVHAVLLCIMLIADIYLLVVFNMVSVCAYGGTLLLIIMRRAYKTVGIIFSAEIICYSLLTFFLVGLKSQVILFYFMLLLMQLMIPYARIGIRVTVSILAFIAMAASVIVGFYIEPFSPIESRSVFIALSVFISVSCFFGLAIEVSLSNILRKIISGRNSELVKKYKNKANTDLLTGLYNRTYSEDFIKALFNVNEDSRWCVAMLDVDNFKKINDTLGHPAGDEVLRGLAQLLTNSFRKTDVLFRWGGEEFLLFLADVDIKIAATVLEKVRNSIADTPVFAENVRIDYTVTIGVASVNLQNVQDSISLCDKRMYHGKQNGKNQVVFE